MIGKALASPTLNRIGDVLFGASVAAFAIAHYYREKAVEQLLADAKKYIEDVQYSRNLLKEVVALREAVETLQKKKSATTPLLSPAAGVPSDL